MPAPSTPKPRKQRPKPLSHPHEHIATVSEPFVAGAAAPACRQVRFAPESGGPATVNPPSAIGPHRKQERTVGAAARPSETAVRTTRHAHSTGCAAAVGELSVPDLADVALRDRSCGAAAAVRRGLARLTAGGCSASQSTLRRAADRGVEACGVSSDGDGDVDDHVLRGLPWLKVSKSPRSMGAICDAQACIASTRRFARAPPPLRREAQGVSPAARRGRPIASQSSASAPPRLGLPPLPPTMPAQARAVRPSRTWCDTGTLRDGDAAAAAERSTTPPRMGLIPSDWPARGTGNMGRQGLAALLLTASAGVLISSGSQTHWPSPSIARNLLQRPQSRPEDAAAPAIALVSSSAKRRVRRFHENEPNLRTGHLWLSFHLQTIVDSGNTGSVAVHSVSVCRV